MSTDQSEGMPGPSERMPMRNSSMTIWYIPHLQDSKTNNGAKVSTCNDSTNTPAVLEV